MKPSLGRTVLYLPDETAYLGDRNEEVPATLRKQKDPDPSPAVGAGHRGCDK